MFLVVTGAPFLNLRASLPNSLPSAACCPRPEQPHRAAPLHRQALRLEPFLLNLPESKCACPRGRPKSRRGSVLPGGASLSSPGQPLASRSITADYPPAGSPFTLSSESPDPGHGTEKPFWRKGCAHSCPCSPNRARTCLGTKTQGDGFTHGEGTGDNSTRRRAVQPKNDGHLLELRQSHFSECTSGVRLHVHTDVT